MTEFDLILWGASGFTGRLTAQYLARTQSAHGARWALGGRDERKLQALRDELAVVAPSCAKLPILTADARDETALAEMAQRTSVLCSTVGPYAQHGSALVAVAARHGTAYCDLTGEPQWIRQMIDAHHAQAEGSGARIVHCCGFESIPADLSVFLLQEEMQQRHGCHSTAIEGFLGPVGGSGVSGGSAASFLMLFEAMASDPAVRQLLENPHGLDPQPPQSTTTPRRRRNVRYDKLLPGWTGPYPMAVLDGLVVQRSHALLGYPWGRQFSFHESVNFGAGPAGPLLAAIDAGAVSLARAAIGISAFRRLLTKLAPAPGHGPSDKALDRGYFVFQFLAKGISSRDGRKVLLHARMSDKGDPGYDGTARMLAESALCLAFDEPRTRGGVLTPATGLGAPLMRRLQRAGLSFEITERSP